MPGLKWLSWPRGGRDAVGDACAIMCSGRGGGHSEGETQTPWLGAQDPFSLSSLLLFPCTHLLSPHSVTVGEMNRAHPVGQYAETTELRDAHLAGHSLMTKYLSVPTSVHTLSSACLSLCWLSVSQATRAALLWSCTHIYPLPHCRPPSS